MSIFTVFILFTPIGGIIIQAAVSFCVYTGLLILSPFVKSIKNDLTSIKYNPFNCIIDYVKQSKYISFYKGVFVIKTNIKRPCSVCMLLINHNINNYFETILKHEYGHIFQQMIMGPIKYLLMIGFPSSMQLSRRSYYCRPWESTADYFGRVSPKDKHSKTKKDYIIAFSYLVVSTTLGPVAFIFLFYEYKKSGV